MRIRYHPRGQKLGSPWAVKRLRPECTLKWGADSQQGVLEISSHARCEPNGRVVDNPVYPFELNGRRIG